MATGADVDTPVDKMWNASRVLERFDCTERSLRRWIKEGKFPSPDCEIGKSRRWKASTLDAFVERGGTRGAT